MRIIETLNDFAKSAAILTVCVDTYNCRIRCIVWYHILSIQCNKRAQVIHSITVNNETTTTTMILFEYSFPRIERTKSIHEVALTSSLVPRIL